MQAACTNEEIWHINQEKNTNLRSSRSKRAIIQLEEAVPLLQKIKFAKFDETVEFHMRLGVDPKHADQMVRGTVVMPNGLGKSKKVLVIASGDKQREATEAGADFVGGEDMVTKIQSESWTDFDAVIATPDMMRSVGKLGKVLGPRGLMPNPKTGTVTVDVAKAVKEVKAGKVEFRVDKTGIIHAPVGKVSFAADKLVENASSLITAVIKAKPAAAKGKYVKSATICSTMGPGVSIDVTPFNAKAARLSARRVIYMKKKDEKQKDLEALRKELEKAQQRVPDRLREADVGQDFELRKTVRGAGGNYKVVKNNIAEKASEGTPAERAAEGSEGHDLAGLHLGRSGGAGQGADGVREDESGVYFQGGNGGRPRDRCQRRSTTWPTCRRRKRFSPSCCILINAPAQRLVTAMSAVGRNLAVVVDQGVKENKFQEYRISLSNLRDSKESRRTWRTSTRLRNRFKGLTLLEASQLVKLLEEKLGVSAAAALRWRRLRRRRRRRRLRRWKRRPSSRWF